ncbi:MAG: desulfoferrodoxin FeS4 iron-binding domain-containing protein [Thermodesulfobacteriota bacterium]|nr:desulfoferrodoxin FeS4 iron-binding domain-containing protein [Thermodesulfobacteriota bacterium]
MPDQVRHGDSRTFCDAVNVKKVGEIYRCKAGGNVDEVLEVDWGKLVCCGQPIVLEKPGE